MQLSSEWSIKASENKSLFCPKKIAKSTHLGSFILLMLDDEVEGQRILLLGDNDVDAEGSQVLGGVRGGFPLGNHAKLHRTTAHLSHNLPLTTRLKMYF